MFAGIEPGIMGRFGSRFPGVRKHYWCLVQSLETSMESGKEGKKRCIFFNRNGFIGKAPTWAGLSSF